MQGEGDRVSGGDDIQAIFLTHLLGGLGERPLPEDLGEALGCLWRSASGEWPQLSLEAKLFVRHLAERIPEDEDVSRALEGLHAGDMFLACACAHGTKGAIEEFESRYSPTILAFISRVSQAPSFVDEVRQILRHKLFIMEGEGPPKIASYSGRGALSSWVGITAQRTALSLIRREGAPARGGAEELAEELSLGNDPELEYLKLRYRAEFKEAFGQAVAALSAKERMNLRLHLINGLSHEKIGAIYKVNQSTVSRWIAHAMETLAESTQRHLREKLHVSSSEFHSLVPLIRSQLELSLVRWLRE